MITSTEKQNDKDFVKEVETFTVYLLRTCHRGIARVKSQNIITQLLSGTPVKLFFLQVYNCRVVGKESVTLTMPVKDNYS